MIIAKKTDQISKLVMDLNDIKKLILAGRLKKLDLLL
jgi:hypothetical protein